MVLGLLSLLFTFENSPNWKQRRSIEILFRIAKRSVVQHGFQIFESTKRGGCKVQ